MANPRLLDIARIRRDGKTQCRAAVCPQTVAEYASLMEDGVTFPPVLVLFDGTIYWLADGFHRIQATLSTGCTEIPAEIVAGNEQDAFLSALDRNTTHGLRLNGRDVEFAFGRLLEHPLSTRMSNRAIAKRLNVSEKTVRRLRQSASAARAADESRLVTRSGRDYVMQLGAIGRSRVHTEHSDERQPLSYKRRNLADLKSDINLMRGIASGSSKSIVNVVANWVLSGTAADAVVRALDGIVTRSCLPRIVHGGVPQNEYDKDQEFGS